MSSSKYKLLMPDFIIIGAARCGTTSLYLYLTEHPCVIPASRKEIHFFDLRFWKGIRWYQAQFPLLLYESLAKQIHKQGFITGEASSYYIFHPHAPKRIFETAPQIKLIALLRNPVDRAISHYYLQRRGRLGRKGRFGVERLSFEKAIEKEKERMRGEMEKMLEDENYNSINHQFYSYLSRGVYIDQLRTWMSFFPKKQILILKSEDYFNNPSLVFKKVLRFLGLPGWKPEEWGKYGRREYPDGRVKYPDISNIMRKRLVDYFKPHNKRLYEYLDVNFDWEGRSKFLKKDNGRSKKNN